MMPDPKRTLALARERIIRTRPGTPAQLHEWLRLSLDVDAPRIPLLPGSSAPFAYLCHAFFEGERETELRDCVVWACRGGGKTFFGAVATLLDLLFKPGVEVRILGGSLEQSRRMHEHLRRLFEAPHLSRLLDGPVTARRVRLRSGSVAEILAQSETSVRGARPQKLRCDEVELFDPDVWRAAQLVTRTKRCGGVTAHASIEALSTMHKPYGLMADLVREESRRVFRWGVVDVLERCERERRCEPCDLLPECGSLAKRAAGHISIDDALRMKTRADEMTWRAEMLCERPSRSDLVLPEFDPAVHVFDDAPEIDEAAQPRKPEAIDPLAPREVCVAAPDVRDRRGLLWVCGMDLGFRAPTVILFACVDAENTLRIVDERVATETTVDAHIASIRGSRWPFPSWIGVDPAANQRSEQTGVSAATVMRRGGLAVRDRRLPMEAGLRLLRARLRPATGSPTLFVHERCARLIESLERYHYPEHRLEATEPVKDGSDHAVDALRYLVQNLDRPERAKVGNYL